MTIPGLQNTPAVAGTTQLNGARLSTIGRISLDPLEKPMTDLSRRSVILAGVSLGAAFVAACQSAPPQAIAPMAAAKPKPGTEPIPAEVANNTNFPSYSLMYGPVEDKFPVPVVNLSQIGPDYLRKEVDYVTSEKPGTIVIDPSRKYLYFVLPNGKAVRYGVGVGREGFGWSGEATINSKQEWPDWYPPKEMIERQPEIRKVVTKLQSGDGMPGGPRNPLGARAMYLWQNNKDTLFRIHGTVEPWTIGKNVSSGCIRMINQDVMDLYNRVPTGTKVVVLGARA
jgi:lipoprotein-anchoring transpeptidase ErfK/SrfK